MLRMWWHGHRPFSLSLLSGNEAMLRRLHFNDSSRSFFLCWSLLGYRCIHHWINYILRLSGGANVDSYDRTVGIWDLVVSLVELFLLPPLKFCADGFWKCFASGFLFCYSFNGEYKKNSRRTISKHRTKSSKIIENRWLPVWIQLIFLQYLTFNISVNNLGHGQIRRFSPGITIHLCFVVIFCRRRKSETCWPSRCSAIPFPCVSSAPLSLLNGTKQQTITTCWNTELLGMGKKLMGFL